MRILLICKTKKMENLGVMYLSSIAKKLGHECMIFDASLAHQVAVDWEPDIIGYSIMTGDQELMKNIYLRLDSQLKKKPLTIVGGPHPTFFWEDFHHLDRKGIVVLGEAENTFSTILGDKSDAYDDIDSLPWPDRTDFQGMQVRDFIASRGCPHDCTYCFNDQWAKVHPQYKRVRLRSAKEVVREVAYTDPKFVYFQDSCFGVSLKWLREFSTLYMKWAGAPFHCHMRPAQVTKTAAMYLENANCVSLRVALETASKKLRKLLNRGWIEIEDVKKAANYLKKSNIDLMIQNMLGLPTATIEDDLETLEFNIQCEPAYAWSSIFVPYPGTVLGDRCKTEGWYLGDYSDLSDSFFDESRLTVSPLHKEQVFLLQKAFALCVETKTMPTLADLTYANFPKFVHTAMRKLGDNRLFMGII